MRIILARHGPPHHGPGTQRAISGHEIGRWYARYNDLGIAAAPPPDDLCALAASAGCVVASDLRRAQESAARLVALHRIETCAALREVGFPDTLRVSWRLSPGAWVALARIAWLLGWCQSDEPLADTRVRAAAVVDHLAALAAVHESVVAIGHGWFNVFVALELRRRGWRGPNPWRRPGYWSTLVYERGSASGAIRPAAARQARGSRRP